MNLARHLATESIGDIDAIEIERMAKAQPYLDAWDGYDLDKTLFRHDEWKGVLHFGEPILPMIEHLKQNLASGKKVKIFTARVSYDNPVINRYVAQRIQDLLFKHVGVMLEVTCRKDMGMRALYDDRAFHVYPNTGTILQPKDPNQKDRLNSFNRNLKAELGQD